MPRGLGPLRRPGGRLDAPVHPDSHEAGITEPVAPFLRPMVVDIRPAPGSKNYYFYQHKPGQSSSASRRNRPSSEPIVARRRRFCR